MSFLNLHDRTVIVAGGAGGIGREIVNALALEGARVVIADLSREAAENVALATRERGGVARAARLDVLSDSSVEALFEECAVLDEKIFGVVNAVGVVGPGAALSCEIKEYQRQIDCNCVGAIRLARAFVAALLSGQDADPSNGAVPDTVHGSYVYISSIAAELAIPDRDPYCVSKAAGQAFHLNLANEVAKYGINVNVVLPGRTDTPIAAERARMSETAATQMFSTQRRAAMIPALTIAKTCAFLLCPDLVGYSGQKVVIAEGADTTYRPSYEALAR
jgi:2-hydroxycyclohexanecarboxyl-CoA dehydrogenase